MKTLGDLAVLPLNKAIELDVLRDTQRYPGGTSQQGRVQAGKAVRPPRKQRSRQATSSGSRKSKNATKKA